MIHGQRSCGHACCLSCLRHHLQPATDGAATVSAAASSEASRQDASGEPQAKRRMLDSTASAAIDDQAIAASSTAPPPQRFMLCPVGDCNAPLQVLICICPFCSSVAAHPILSSAYRPPFPSNRQVDDVRFLLTDDAFHRFCEAVTYRSRTLFYPEITHSASHQDEVKVAANSKSERVIMDLCDDDHSGFPQKRTGLRCGCGELFPPLAILNLLGAQYCMDRYGCVPPPGTAVNLATASTPPSTAAASAIHTASADPVASSIPVSSPAAPMTPMDSAPVIVFSSPEAPSAVAPAEAPTRSLSRPSLKRGASGGLRAPAASSSAAAAVPAPLPTPEIGSRKRAARAKAPAKAASSRKPAAQAQASDDSDLVILSQSINFPTPLVRGGKFFNPVTYLSQMLSRTLAVHCSTCNTDLCGAGCGQPPHADVSNASACAGARYVFMFYLLQELERNFKLVSGQVSVKEGRLFGKAAPAAAARGKGRGRASKRVTQSMTGGAATVHDNVFCPTAMEVDADIGLQLHPASLTELKGEHQS